MPVPVHLCLCWIIFIFLSFCYLNRCAVLYLSVAKRNAFQFALAPLFISLPLHHILSVLLPLTPLPMWACLQHRDGERFQRPDTIHSQKAICGKYIIVVPWAVLLSFAVWWSGWSYRGLQTMVTDWAKLTTTLLSTVKLTCVA